MELWCLCAISVQNITLCLKASAQTSNASSRLEMDSAKASSHIAFVSAQTCLTVLCASFASVQMQLLMNREKVFDACGWM